jgi:hypothetical protein
LFIAISLCPWFFFERFDFASTKSIQDVVVEDDFYASPAPGTLALFLYKVPLMHGHDF